MAFDRQAYSKEYAKEQLQVVRFQLNREKDADIIEHLDSKKNMAKYIKELIRKDMKG